MKLDIKILLIPGIVLYLLLYSNNLFSQNFSQKTADSLKHIAKITKNDIELIKIYTQISTLYSQKERDSALFYAELAMLLVDKSGNYLQKARVLNIKADIYRLHNDFNQSIKIDERALEIAEQNADSILMCEIYNDIGVTYRRLDDDAEAIKYHLWALEIARNIADSVNLSKALNSIGIIYFGLERYDDAEKHYREALRIETERKNLLGIAINYNTIAEIYQRRLQFDKAIEYYGLSIKANLANKDSMGVAICHNDLGYTYFLMENYQQAQAYTLLAYKYFKEKKKYRELAYSLLNLGKIFIVTEKYAGALKYLKECEKIAGDYDFKAIKHQCWLSIAETYENIGYLSLALKYQKLAYEQYEIINLDKELKISAELEAKYQIKTIKNENELLLEKDKINNIIILRQRIIFGVISLLGILLIITLLMMLRSRKKVKAQKALIEKKHIELLERNNEILSQKEKINEQNEALSKQKNELIAANASKDLFLSIIAHDLRNPFNAFLSLSNILLEDYKTLRDDEKIEMISLIHESAGNAYRLLENLLSWAKSQTGALETKKEIFYVSSVAEEVLETEKLKLLNKNIDIDYNIGASVQAFADRNMIMTVIRNLVSNAVKFTPRGGKISLFSKVKSNFVEVTVSDTGIGIKPESVLNIFNLDGGFKRKGTEDEKGSGLGLILCKDFVEKNGGKIQVKSKVEKGSSFTFTIPLPENNL